MVCSGSHVDEPEYQRWLPAVGQAHGRHRKVWEWCYILQALETHGLARPGSSAIGFGVGTEPLVSALVSRGVRVLATDQAADTAGSWASTGQHASARDALRRPDLCADDEFDRLVTFRPVDMRTLPADLGQFDIAWSSCCFEHLGSADAGCQFVLDAMDVVAPGGVAVHTTEIDCSRHGTLLETGSVEAGDYVCFYRRQDLERLVARLRAAGHEVRCNYFIGKSHPLEREVDRQPYTHDPHIRLEVQDRVVTSFGLTVVKRR